MNKPYDSNLSSKPDNFRHNDKKPRNKRKQITNFITVLSLIFLIICLSVILKAYISGEFDSIDTFQGYIKKYGAFGPLFLTIFQAVQVVIPVLPGFLGCAAGALMFGPLIGFLCNYIGIGGGSIVAFLLARKYGMPLLDDLFPAGKYKKWAKWASNSKSYSLFLFAAMILPLFPDDYLCYLTGVTRMTVKKFVWIIILGKPWCILAYSFGFSLIK